MGSGVDAPAGRVGFDRFLMRDLRWEHVAVSALTPMGQGGLAEYTPTIPVPTLEQMISRLLDAGLSQCNIADGGESYWVRGRWTASGMPSANGMALPGTRPG